MCCVLPCSLGKLVNAKPYRDSVVPRKDLKQTQRFVTCELEKYT